MPLVSSQPPTIDQPAGGRPGLFVTGGARGLGADIVRYAALRGHDVAFTYRDGGDAAAALVDELTAVAGTGRVLAVAMDQRQTGSVDAAIDAAVREIAIDAAICNAGIARTGLMATMGDADWNDVVDTNLGGTFRVCRRFLMYFLGRRHGRFVHIGSIAAAGMSGHAAYAASKAGIEALSGSIAREYGAKGIASNVVSLGLCDGGMGERDASETLRRFWLSHCPQRRLGTGDDLAAMVLFLASAAFVNGQVINLTGGLDWTP